MTDHLTLCSEERLKELLRIEKECIALRQGALETWRPLIKERDTLRSELSTVTLNRDEVRRERDVFRDTYDSLIPIYFTAESELADLRTKLAVYEEGMPSSEDLNAVSGCLCESSWSGALGYEVGQWLRKLATIQDERGEG